MAKEMAKEKTVEVTFTEPWSGSFNGFKVEVTKYDFMTDQQLKASSATDKYKGTKRSVPPLMKEWLKKFDVTR